MDEATVELFAGTRLACRAVGWEFSHVGVPDPVLMANVRWLSRYRRRRCGRRRDFAARLTNIFAEPTPLLAGAVEAGDRLLVLPVLFHLLWSGILGADLDGGLLQAESLVWAERRLR
jgi:hypothetical protein